MKYFKTYEQWEAKTEKDYSGEYYSLREFIELYDLQNEYVDYLKAEGLDDITIDNWDEYVEDDENEIIKFLGTNYNVFYHDEKSGDYFEIEKKKVKGSIGEVEVRLLTEEEQNDAHVIIEESGIYSEYEGRIGAFIKGGMVGATTMDVEDKEYYRFDIGIDPQYQGYGISTKLLQFMFEDAKKIGHHYITAQVTNPKLFKTLGDKYGFNLESDSGQKYATKRFKKYIGQCDKLRVENPDNKDFEKNEAYWQEMDKNKIEISVERFIDEVNMYNLLDEDDTPLSYIEQAKMSDNETATYISNWGDNECMFLYCHDYEFIYV